MTEDLYTPTLTVSIYSSAHNYNYHNSQQLRLLQQLLLLKLLATFIVARDLRSCDRGLIHIDFDCINLQFSTQLQLPQQLQLLQQQLLLLKLLATFIVARDLRSCDNRLTHTDFDCNDTSIARQTAVISHKGHRSA